MVKLNGRWPLIIPEHRAVRPEWSMLDGWEGERLLAIHRAITDDVGNWKQPLVYYVGAEEGDMCGLIASWGARLVMFEPNRRVWPNIRAIWEANNLLKPCGTWVGFAGHETTGVVEFIDKDWPSCSDGPVIGDHGFCNLHERTDIPSVTIDDYVRVTDLVPTDISIDVEGSEGRVIDGAVDVIREHHPRIWLSGHPEFMLQNWGAWTNVHMGHPEYLLDLRTRLVREFGYSETLLSYEHEVHLMYEVM